MFGRDIFDRNVHPALCNAADRTFESLRGEICRAQDGGALRRDQSADAMAAAAWAMIHGLADLLLSGRLADVAQGDDGQELTSSLAKMMLEGVLARN
jgi:hypothetical protein